MLYNASAELNAAQNYAGILQTLRRHSALGAVDDYISLELFDQPWIGDETQRVSR